MLADAKEGLIDLILVKDLSRIGRNHLLVGALIETILPEMECRFIALNNHIDTLDHDSPHMDYVGFMNLFNENYSRQTSRKVKSIRKSLAEQGKFLGTYAPYGYLKNPENKHQLIPDPETVSIVKRIFHMRCMGNSFRSIAAALNQEGIPSPRTLYYQRRGTDNPNHENGLWNESGIQGIIRNEVYIGNMVQNKKETVSFKSKKLTAKSEDYWIRVENTPEPLIDRKTRDIVCELEKKHSRLRKPKGDVPVSIFTGLLKCADCGFNMRSLIERRTNRAGEVIRYVSFMCNNYSRSGKSACTIHSISERKLRTLVLEDIRYYAKLANENEYKLIQQILKQKTLAMELQAPVAKQRYNELIIRISDLEVIVQQLYEDRSKGLVPENSFQMLMNNYGAELEKCKLEKKALDESLRTDSERLKNIADWVKAIRKYEDISELNREILLELVEQFSVFEARNDIDSRIKILYKIKMPRRG